MNLVLYEKTYYNLSLCLESYSYRHSEMVKFRLILDSGYSVKFRLILDSGYSSRGGRVRPINLIPK